MVTFTGKEQVAIYQALVLRSALRLYDRTGMRANRSYSPALMMRTAARLTGKTFRPRDYKGAIAALSELMGDMGDQP